MNKIVSETEFKLLMIIISRLYPLSLYLITITYICEINCETFQRNYKSFKQYDITLSYQKEY